MRQNQLKRINNANTLDTTAYLLSSPKNTQILEESIASIKNWKKTGLKKLVSDIEGVKK